MKGLILKDLYMMKKYCKAYLLIIIGLCTQLAILLIIGIARAIRMDISDASALREYLVLMMLVLIMSLLASSITLPFMFKFGVEKGRMAYYIMIGVVCAGSIISSNLLSGGVQSEIKANGLLPVICIIGIGVYALSWYLSIVFYKRREI